MEKIRVHKVRTVADAVELTVFSLADAEWLAENARLAGFVAKVKPQADGLTTTKLHPVLIGGKVDAIRTYLGGNSELELPENW